MRTAALALLFSSIWAPPVRAAWAKVPILEVPERISGATVGRVEDRESLLVLHGPELLVVRWDGSRWDKYEIDVRTGARVAPPVAAPAPSLSAGIGASLRVVDGLPAIEAIIANGAAAVDQRLQIGDRIEAVAQDGGEFVATLGLPLEKVTSLIRGEAGTKVRLRVIPAAKTKRAPNIVELRRKPLFVSRKRSVNSGGTVAHSVIQSAFGIHIKKYPLELADGRNDGVVRLYLGLPEELAEYTPGPGSWAMVKIPLPGNESDYLSAAKSNLDRKTHLFISRNSPVQTPAGSKCTSFKTTKIYECVDSGELECRSIAAPCPGMFVVNIPGTRGIDVLLGAHYLLTRGKNDGWASRGEFHRSRYLVPSRRFERTVYGDGGMTEFSPDFSGQTTRGFGVAGGEVVSGGEGVVEPKGRTRVFVGSDDWHVYEVVNPAGEPKLEDIGKAAGVPWFILSGDIRGTGFEHLYVTEEGGNTFEGGGSRISEYTYYKTKSSVAVVGFEVRGNSPGGGSEVGGAVLGNLLRKEMLKFGHLELVETDNVDKVLAEREFQAAQCRDAACLSRIGSLLHAQAVLSGSVEPAADGFRVGLRALDVRGERVIFSLSRPAQTVDDIPDAIVELAKASALAWPHSLSPEKADGTR